MKKYLLNQGIIHNISPPYTAEHNGMAERSNRIVIDMARCMLLNSNLTLEWRAKSVQTAAATANLLPSLSRGNKSPFELIYKKSPKSFFLRVFGCRSWVHKPKQLRDSKFNEISWECILIGYTNEYSSYKVVRLTDKKIFLSRHVHFDESCFPRLNAINPSLNVYKEDEILNEEEQQILPFQDEQEDENEIEDENLLIENEQDNDDDEKEEEYQMKNEITRDSLESNIIQKRTRSALILMNVVPKNHFEAIKCEESEEWKKAETK
jgi:hypothetical protein